MDASSRITAVADPDERFHAALDDALTLVDIVHGGGSEVDVARILRQADIPAVCVALAACVDQNKTITELLGWTLSPTELAQVKRWNELAAAHTYYGRCRKNSQPCPPDVLAMEQEFQRLNKAGQRRRIEKEAVAS